MGNIRLDHQGIGEILRNECAGIVAEATEQIAAAVRNTPVIARQGIPVTTGTGITGSKSPRASGVIVVHTRAPGSGAALEAKYGVLIGAASSIGVEVTSE